MKVRWVLAGLLSAGALTACADGVSAPSAPSTRTPLATKMYFTSDTSGYFTLDPSKRVTVTFADQKLTIPANAVCDLGSSYGAGEWDKPCAPAAQPFTVQVTWGTTADGHTAVRFYPDLRFIPTASTKANDWVMLTVKDQQDLAATGSTILWQDPATGAWVDEGADDPSVRAYNDPSGRKVMRRLKHFSGYVVGVGFASGGLLGGVDLGVEVSLY